MIRQFYHTKTVVLNLATTASAVDAGYALVLATQLNLISTYGVHLRLSLYYHVFNDFHFSRRLFVVRMLPIKRSFVSEVDQALN